MLQIDTYETIVTLGIRYAIKNEIQSFEYFIFVYIVKLQKWNYRVLETPFSIEI